MDQQKPLEDIKPYVMYEETVAEGPLRGTKLRAVFSALVWIDALVPRLAVEFFSRDAMGNERWLEASNDLKDHVAAKLALIHHNRAMLDIG